MDSANKRPKENKYLRKLMYELFYPAILGLGLVELLAHLARYTSTEGLLDEPLSLGLLFVLFFSVSFLGSANPEAIKYTALSFVLDIVEVVLMFFCFYWLKLGPEGTGNFNRCLAYLMLVFVQPVEFCWRCSVGIELKWKREIFRGVAIAVLLTGMFMPVYGGWTSVVVFVVIFVLLIIYEVQNLS